MTARVSVIVTCFNLGRYLEETLASIAAQTYRDFELCIVDDGSDDPATTNLLDRLQSQVRVVRTENHGLSAARNVGVSLTAGEYICCVDADDLLAPALLERSVAHLDANPSVAFVSHWLEAFGDESWEWKPQRCDFPALLDANTVNGAALVRRSAIEAVGGWDESMRDGCEDWDLWISLVERSFRGDIIPEVLFRYRRRHDSMSRVKFAGDGHARLYRRLIDKHAGTFRAHLKTLLRRREVDLIGTRRLADDLDERLELEVVPSLARARDDLASAERLKEAASLRTALEAARAEARRLDALRHRAEHEVAELRASLSWRLTQPLRTLAGLVIDKGIRRR